MPAISNHISYCDSTYHGLHYCEFSDNFSLTKDELATAITWFDVGCNSADAAEMTLSYDIVNADTYELVAQTPQGSKKNCELYYPPDHGTPTTLAITPTVLAANQEYFLILRAEGNPRNRAYWGTDERHHASFQVWLSPASEAPRDIKEPVIIVPGILGSSLQRTTGEEVWPNVDEMLQSANDSYLDDLKLGPAGLQVQGREMNPGKVIEVATARILGHDFEHVVYGNLVKQFTDAGYRPDIDLFLVPYDWRLDLRNETTRLQGVITQARAISPNGKVTLIAHSMGGLLVKQYLTSLADNSFVDKVILVGVPQLGAPAMFKTLNYGDNLGFTFPIINKDFLSAAKIKDISQNMPGAYELLPSKRYVSLSGGYVKDFRDGGANVLSYEGTNTLMTKDRGDFRNKNLLIASEAFHEVLDDKKLQGPKVYNLVACDNPATIGEIQLYDQGKIDITSTNGDGTVPLISAMRLADDYTNYFVSSRQTGIDHMGLVKDARTTQLIKQLATGSEAPLPAGIAGTSTVCFPAAGSVTRTIRFSTHSPGNLDLYDPDGNHAGIAADGSIDLSIPGSSYIKLGQNSFAFVPAGKAYRAVASGLSSGKLTLQTEVMEGAEIVDMAQYKDIPINSAAGSATLSFSGNDHAPSLSVDQNGDGAADQSIAPATYLFGGFLPPVANDGSGIYKLGKVIPLRFQLKNADGSFVSNAKATFTLTKLSDQITGTHKIRGLKRRVKFGKEQSFVYRPKPKEYAFDLQTTTLTVGTWELELSLDDGKTYSLTLSFR